MTVPYNPNPDMGVHLASTETRYLTNMVGPRTDMPQIPPAIHNRTSPTRLPSPTVTQTPPAPAPTPGGTPAPTPTPSTPAPTVPTQTPQQSYDAFQKFADSAGIKFATQQAMDALQNQYAAHGLLQSGAAMKGISDYVQNMALQNYLYPYMNYLTGQQAMGAQAASALGGVGSSYGNTVSGMGQNYANAATNINSNMGNALSQGALNIGNANANNAAIGGLANGQLYSTIGSQLGSLGSSFVQPHY